MVKCPKYQLWKSPKDGKFYFHLKARNGEIILESQGYRSKRAAVNTIHRIIDLCGRLAKRGNIIEDKTRG